MLLKVIVTLSNPFEINFLPSESPIPAKSVTGLSLIGSDTKHRHTSNVFDIIRLSCVNDSNIRIDFFKLNCEIENASKILFSLVKFNQKCGPWTTHTKSEMKMGIQTIKKCCHACEARCFFYKFTVALALT